MALTITVTNPHTIAIIEQEAARQGISETEAVDRLVADRHPSNPDPGARKPETPEERAARLAEADRILRELQGMMTEEDRKFDYNAWLYDENGLPH